MIQNLEKGRGVTGAMRYVMGQGNDAETGERRKLGEGQESRATILGGQNFGFAIETAEDAELARRAMEWNGAPENQWSRARKCELDCWHTSLSWGIGQTPDRAEMIEAAQSCLKAHGMENAMAVFVAHDDKPFAHIHIVASRIDPETGKTYSQKDDYITARKWEAKWERDHGQQRDASAGKNLHGLIDAVNGRDADALLALLTCDKATFTQREVVRAISYGDLSKDEGSKFRDDILARSNVIGLRETAEAPVARYTTREILAAEMALQRDAGALAEDKRHGVDAFRIDLESARYTLKPEQDAAMRHLTGAAGFAILYGEAGTGKSHTLKAVRAVYEAEGKNVIGLAWTNPVVNQLRGQGFEANTITSELNALEKGRTSWTAKTVIVVDEAAMLSTEALGRVTAAAKKAGAKLLLAGDDQQLGSVASRGGMFETLRVNHGAAILKEVQRNKDAEQAAAYGQMHEGAFLEPLKTFEKKGFIHWTARQADTLKDMAARYAADVEKTPEKSRFMFAIKNTEVDALNRHARALHKARGDLGKDHALKTATGEQQFSVNDRIQFTGNARTKQERIAGFVNGAVGTVRAIEVDEQNRARVTVELDAEKGAKPQSVSFIVGENEKAGEFEKFRHGYAGTIYRGQGRTLDQAYVGHSALWRRSASYVALTRHREEVHIFAARETVNDIEAMAEGMARADNKRAATAYKIDEQSAARAELAKAVDEYLPSPRLRQAGQTAAAHETATMESAAPPAVDMPSHAPEQATGEAAHGGDIVPELSAGRALDAPASSAGQVLSGAAHGLSRFAEGAADLAASAIEGLAGLFGGGSSAPMPQQEQPAAPRAPTPAAPTPAPKQEQRKESPPTPAENPAKERQEATARQVEHDRSHRRQRFLRDFDREVPDEQQHEIEIERGRKRDGGRERQRGE